jgi:hypothetical protein
MKKTKRPLITQNLPVREITKGHLTCGECAGLSVEGLIKRDVRNCSTEGKLKTSRACPKFQADPTVFREAFEDEGREEGMREIAEWVSTMNTRHIRGLAGALLNEVTTRQNGWHMWQSVIVRFRGTASSNYMSNFMSARVLNADANVVRIISEDGKVVMRYANTGDAGPSLYSVEEFEPLKERMIEKGALVDQSQRQTPKHLRAEDHKDVEDILSKLKTNGTASIYTMEEVVRNHNRKSPKGKRIAGKSNDKIMDLTNIAKMMESGARMVKSNEDGVELIDSPKRTRRSKEIEVGDLD